MPLTARYRNRLASLVRGLICGSSITALLVGVSSYAASPITKSASGTDLSNGASWGGTAPTAADTATWNASSLGAGLTLGANAQWDGVAITGASSDVSISGAGTLTLGSGGIDMSASTVNFSMANNIALLGDQTWKAAVGKTITASGVISGSAGLTLGSALAESVTSTIFLTDTEQTLFSNTSLSSVVAASGNIGGAWIGGGTVIGNGYLLSNDGSTATYWLEALDGGFTKGVQITLIQSGVDITAKATAAKNVSGSKLGFNFNTGGTSAPLATSPTGAGYGAKTTTLQIGYDSSGTVVLSGANTYTGPTNVARGVLRAGVASVAGVSGAFGKDSAVSLSNTSGTMIDLNGFNTQIGSITGGGTSGGDVTLGSATLTVGGDDTSPAAYAGVISGTGGFAKIGSGTQILSGLNTYSGGTTVSGTGMLIGSAGVAFNATQGGAFGTGDITVNTGATIRSTTFFVIGGGQNTTRTINLLGGTANLQGAGAGGEYIKTLNLTGGTVTADSSTVFFRVPNGGTSLSSLAASTSSTITTRIDMTLGDIAVDTAKGSSPDGQDLIISGNITQNTGAGSGARSLVKTGAGTLVLSGTDTYTGNTTVSGGTLAVTGSISGSSQITVENGATLLDAGSFMDCIGDLAPITLGGGAGSGPAKLKIDNSSSQIFETVGALTLASNSILDIGTGVDGIFLNFGDSSTNAWTPGTTLSIYNWSSNVDHISFGFDSNALTSAQLSSIKFYSDAGTTFLSAAKILPAGEIVPVAIPEPSALAMGVGMLGYLFFNRRRAGRWTSMGRRDS